MTHDIDLELELYGDSTIAYKMKQGDINSRFLCIALTKKGAPLPIESGATVTIYVLKPDDKQTYTYCKVLDAQNGIIEAPLTQQALALVGDIYFEILISGTRNGNQYKLSFPLVKTTVDDSIWDNESIESSIEFSALVDALDRVETLEQRILYMETIIENSIILE